MEGDARVGECAFVNMQLLGFDARSAEAKYHIVFGPWVP